MKKSFYFVTFSPVLKHCSRICFFVVTLSSTDCLSHLQVLNPLYLLATLLGTIARPSFSFRTAIILCGTDSTRCWKHSSDILVHFDTTVSHIYRRLFGCTSMMRFNHFPKVLCWIVIWWLWGPFECSEFTGMFNHFELMWFLWYDVLPCWRKPPVDGYKWISNNTGVSCGVLTMLSWGEIIH